MHNFNPNNPEHTNVPEIMIFIETNYRHNRKSIQEGNQEVPIARLSVLTEYGPVGIHGGCVSVLDTTSVNKCKDSRIAYLNRAVET